MPGKRIRWGLLGAGAILNRWMKGAVQVGNMEIAAVSSRTPETAEKMRAKFGIPEALSYDELLERDDIDVVYVAVPHTAHKELAIRAMRAGKAVLVEKPAAVTAADWEEMTACAKECGVFLMEAVWTRFFPLIAEIRKIIEAGEIGSVRAVQSAFSFRTMPGTGDSRLLDPARAGGGLLDTGVYNLHFADIVYGKAPQKLTGLASFDTDELHLKIDEQAAYVAQYDRGELAVMASGVRTDMDDTAYIYGTEGQIVVPVFWKPVTARVTTASGTRTIECPVPQCVEGVEDEGYQFEIAYVNVCLREGVTESPVVPWHKTAEVLACCDELRKSWNYRYPFEV